MIDLDKNVLTNLRVVFHSLLTFIISEKFFGKDYTSTKFV